MKKNSQPKGRRPPRNRENEVELHFKASKLLSTGATGILALVTLDSDTATVGLPAYAASVLAYFDMYRYFRIKRISVTIVPQGGGTTSASGVLAHLAPGATTVPTLSTGFETKNQVLVTSYPQRSPPLHLSQKDLAGIGGWCVTQSDATDAIFKSFGTIYLATSYADISSWWPEAFVFVDAVLEFKTLLDPSTISQKFNLHPAAPEAESQTPGYEQHVRGCRCESCN
jgi:hypothetical protein